MSKDNLRPEDLDQLGQALITLTQELWVMKDRVRVLETALTDAGVITADTIDSFQPDAALQETLGKERAQLIEQVLGALERQDP
jgi:hypothetical protein